MKKTIAAAMLCAMVTASAVQAQTIPTGGCRTTALAGKWNVTFNNGFHSRSQIPVTIDAAGNMSGGVLVNDGMGMPSFGFRSITPIKVDAKCNVTGQFGVFYGGPPPLRSYAFRASMSLDGLRIGYTAIKWPGYDEAAHQDREMWIVLERAPQ